MRKLLLFLFIFISVASFAQVTVLGTVRDEAGPVPSVFILQNGVQLGMTNNNGQFKVEIDPNVELVFHGLGYDELHLGIQYFTVEKRTQPLDVVMQKSTEILSDVVITAGRFEQKTEESPISIDVLKPYLIKERAQTEIEQTVQQASGVNVTDGQINIRSGSGWSYGAGTRVLMLLDEMPLISPDAGQAQWSLIPTEAVSQVEVVKGAASSLYGTSAMNGIMNVRTLEPTYKPHTDIQLYQGFYDNPRRSENKWWDGVRGWTGTQFSHTFSRGENNQYGWVIAGQAEHDAGCQYDVPDHRARFLTKFKYANPDAPEWDYEVMATGLWSETGDALLWNGYNEAYVPLDSLATRTTGFDFFIDPKVTYHGGLGTHVLRGRFMAINNNARTATTSYENYSQMGFAEYLWQVQFGRVLLISGISGQLGTSNSEVFDGVHQLGNGAAYVQAEYDLKWLKATAGVRYEGLTLDDKTWSRPVMRFGLNGGTQATRFRASYGEGFRFPTMAEMFTRTSVGALQVFPNYDLEPESGSSIEIGARQLFKLGGFQGYIDVALFQMSYQNMMEFSFGRWGTGGSTVFEDYGFRSINIGDTKVEGVELSTFVEYEFSESSSLKWMGGMSWMDPSPNDPNYVYATYPGFLPGQPDNEMSYQTTSSNPESNVLKYRYKMLFKTDLQWDWYRWSVGTSVRYNDFMQNIDQIFVDPLFSQFIPGVEEARTNQSDGDWLLDVRLKYMASSDVSITLVVNNLLNREYYPRPALVGAPRSFVIQLRYNI